MQSCGCKRSLHFYRTDHYIFVNETKQLLRSICAVISGYALRQLSGMLGADTKFHPQEKPAKDGKERQTGE
jgi:hypothetical protein